jgi:hypothetical protein
MMGMTFAVADMGCDGRDYDNWLTTLTGASARLDDLQTALTEVRYLCESGGVDSEQIRNRLFRTRSGRQSRSPVVLGGDDAAVTDS